MPTPFDVRVYLCGQHWLARWYDTHGRMRSKRLGAKKHVTKIAAMGLGRRLAATFVAYPSQGERPRLVTLGAWIEEHVHLSSPDWSPRTKARVESGLDELRTYFTSDRPIARIPAGEAMEFRAYLLRASDDSGRGLAPATVASTITHAKALFRRAVQTGLLSTNPFDDVPSAMPTMDPTWHLPTIHEVRVLIAAGATPDERLLLALCAFAGLRAGEAARLRACDVASARLIVRNAAHVVTTKARTREVRVEPDLRAMLLPWAKDRTAANRADDPLLTDDEMNTFRKGVPALFARAGVKRWDKCLQTLRRFRENAWLDTYPIPIVSAWMGHSPAVSQRFYRQVPAHHYDLAEDGGVESQESHATN